MVIDTFSASTGLYLQIFIDTVLIFFTVIELSSITTCHYTSQVHCSHVNRPYMNEQWLMAYVCMWHVLDI